MVEKDPQICALNVGELDIFVDSMEPSQIELIGNQSYVYRYSSPLQHFKLEIAEKNNT